MNTALNFDTYLPRQDFRPRVLIVEDDITLEPLWENVLERAYRGATYIWASSAQEAIYKMYQAKESGQPFDLVISDIFLSSSQTGLDLWNQFQDELDGRFIVVSGLSYKKYLQKMSKSDRPPLFLRKPLNIPDCVETVHFMLTHKYKL